MSRLRSCLWSAIALLSSCGATAGPPLNTDDPGLAGAGMLEVLVAASHQSRKGERVDELAVVDLTYGVNGRLDMLFAVGWSHTRPEAGPSPEALPVTAGVKLMLRSAASGPAVSLAPAFTTDARSDEQAIFLPLQAQADAGPWQLGGELGYRAVRSGSDEWQLGAYAARPLSGGSVLLAEVWAIDLAEGNGRESGWSIGAEVALSDEMRLLVSAGGGFSARGTEVLDSQLFLGLQRTVSCC